MATCAAPGLCWWTIFAKAKLAAGFLNLSLTQILFYAGEVLLCALLEKARALDERRDGALLRCHLERAQIFLQLCLAAALVDLEERRRL